MVVTFTWKKISKVLFKHFSKLIDFLEHFLTSRVSKLHARILFTIRGHFNNCHINLLQLRAVFTSDSVFYTTEKKNSGIK